MGEEFFHEAVVERSWAALLELRRRCDFVLIGGWAVWLYARGARSRDIDVIVDYGELARLRCDYELRKNGKLARYEIGAGLFDVRIYVPYYSTGLVLPPEYVLGRVRNREGFRVPDPEVLLALALGDWGGRRGSPGARREWLDVRRLLSLVSREGFAAVLAGSEIAKERAGPLLKLFDEACRTVVRERGEERVRERDGLEL